MTASVRIVGPGRAGGALARGLEKAGWDVLGILGRDDDLRSAALGVDLLVVATPDTAVPTVAAAVEPVATTVIAHMAGALELDVLAGHRRRASLHPLRSLPSPASDITGAWWAVDGDEVAERVVADLDGRCIRVTSSARASYHAAAVIASNHLVALLGSVERVGATAGVPLDAFFDLVRGTVDNVEALGPRAALTGPVARGDWDAVDRHLGAIPESDRRAYLALAESAAALVGTSLPARAPGSREG